MDTREKICLILLAVVLVVCCVIAWAILDS